MKKLYYLIFLSLYLPCALPSLNPITRGEWLNGECYSKECFNGGLSFSFQNQNIEWKFSAPASLPDLTSKIQFKDLHILKFEAKGEALISECIFLKGNFTLGAIVDGYYEETVGVHTPFSNRCYELRHIDKKKTIDLIEGRNTSEISFGLGYPLFFCCGSLKIIPLLGYDYIETNLKVHQNDQIRLTETPLIFNYRGLELKSILCSDKKYSLEWWGPWIGADIAYTPIACWNIFSEIKFQILKFKGKRFTNLGFPSFDIFNERNSGSRGFMLRFGGKYSLAVCSEIGLSSTFQSLISPKHKHHLKCSNSFFKTLLKSRSCAFSLLWETFF